jgi:hypothetical protein
MPPSSYHVLTFPDRISIAAFVAACSRVPDRSAVEIWVHATESQAYLSDAALAMVTRAFAPPPVIERVTLPMDAHLVVDATTPAMGLLEAERRLAP